MRTRLAADLVDGGSTGSPLPHDRCRREQYSGHVSIILDLSERGAKHLAIISGDNEQPTRKLAARLGIDRFFFEVLPQDKAKYVELLLCIAARSWRVLG
jgi:cation transport ATPase